MHELEALLKHHDSDFKFDHYKNRVQCFPHIINICISHIITSSTRVFKEYLKSLKSEGDDGLSYSDVENGDDDDNSHNNIALPRKIRQDIPKLKLKNFELDELSAEDQAWFSGMNHDPIKRARTVVCILHSSDQRKRDFKEVIKNGNKSGWFRGVDSFVTMVPDLEPLCDVKTQWDSTYTMIERLVVLRPVSIPAASCFNHGV
jgi:hypothetical protein